LVIFELPRNIHPPKRTVVIISGKSKLVDSGKNHLPDLSNVVVKDLREYGVEQAGTYKGGVEAYKGMLNKIRSGSILTEQDSVRLVSKTEETKKRIQKQIDSLLEKYYELKSRADEIHNSRDITKGLVPIKQTEINLLKNQLDEIETTRSSLHNNKYNTFSWGTYIFLFFLLLALSFYLLYFYMSVADFALNGVDPLSLFQEGRLNIQLLPNLRRLIYLIINYPPLIVFPTIFFALGTSIHLFSEKGLRFRKVVIGLMVLVFVGDLLLAFQVHTAVNEILIKANREEFKTLVVPVYSDSRFFLVLFLGFGVFAIWSAVYYLMQMEWAKRNQIKLRYKRISRLQDEILELEEKRMLYETEINHIAKRIENLSKEKDRMVLPVDTIEKNINYFRDGWNGYLSTLYGRDKGEEMIKIINESTESYIKDLKEFQESYFK
jgi:peptidoglycan hydrolase CwlO-like protein